MLPRRLPRPLPLGDEIGERRMVTPKTAQASRQVIASPGLGPT